MTESDFLVGVAAMLTADFSIRIGGDTVRRRRTRLGQAAYPARRVICGRGKASHSLGDIRDREYQANPRFAIRVFHRLTVLRRSRQAPCLPKLGGLDSSTGQKSPHSNLHGDVSCTAPVQANNAGEVELL
jgi:hypothetical protein